MTPNFVIRKNGEDLLTAERIDWISYATDQTVGMRFNTSPKEGYCMIADMEIPSIENLMLSDLKASQAKTTWTFRSEPIDKMIDSNREYVKFESAGDTYEIDIRVNKTPKPRTTPVTKA